MAEYKHGSMNVDEQEKTFHGFVKWVANAIVIIIVALILLALING